MKNKILILITAAFLFASCSINKKDLKPYPVSSLKDKEPNDVFNSANEASSQELILGFFNENKNSADKDYYKVNIAVKGISYKIIQTAVPGIDSRISIFSPDKKRIHSVDGGKKGDPEKMWEYYPLYPYIYLLAESKASYNERVPYIIEFIPLVDESAFEEEPNNDKESALTIKINEEKKGLISPEGDLDFYRIDLNGAENSDFSIELETQSNHDFGFMIINETNDKVKFINNFGWGEKESFHFLSGSKGKYLIKVFMSMNQNDNSSPSYSLKISKSSELIASDINDGASYEKELNDTKDNATELIRGKTMYGTLFPANDEDWFKFDSGVFSRNGRLLLSRIRNINTKMEVYSSNMKLVASSDSGKSDEQEEIVLSNLDMGTYYVKISGDDKSLVVYKLKLTSQ